MQLNRILTACAVGLLLIGPGCSKSDSKTAQQKPGSQLTNSAKGAAVSGLAADPFQDAQLTNKLEKLSASVVESLQNADAQAFKACFDQDALLEEILLGVKASGRNFDAFKKGMRVGVNKTLGTLADNWASQEMKYKGIVNTLGRPALRFRFISPESAVAFVDFLTVRKQNGDYGICNVYNQSAGFDMAAQVRQAAVPLLADMDKSVLQRLLNKPQLKASEIEEFGDLSKSFAEGKYQACIDQFQTLAPQLKNTLAAHMLYIGALQKMGDMEGYRRALKEAAAQFKETSFEFMLVDVYFLEEKYEKAEECLNSFSKKIGPDGALLALKSTTLQAKGQTAEARKILSEAMALEPESAFVHSRGLDVLLAARDFKAVRESIQFLEKNAGLQFKGNLTDDIWSEFRKAPESLPWR